VQLGVSQSRGLPLMQKPRQLRETLRKRGLTKLPLAPVETKRVRYPSSNKRRRNAFKLVRAPGSAARQLKWQYACRAR
jgi:hypothetical protein